MKNCITIISLMIIIIGLLSYIFYNKTEKDYKTEIKEIKTHYKIINDSLLNEINKLDSIYNSLDSINNNLSYDIDSIKNNQHDDEKPKYFNFDNLSNDSIISIFTKYDPNAYRRDL